MFALFSTHAALFTLAEKPSCGCLGDVTVPPLISLTADLTLLLLLVLGWPAWRGWPLLTSTGRTLMQTAGIATILLVGVIGRANVQYGSVHAAVSVARGDPVTITDRALNLGRTPANGSAVATLRVRNNSGDVLQIAMADSGCSCAKVQDLPVNIPPGASADVSVLITVSAEPGDFRRAVRLQTSMGILPYTITAVVVPPPSEIVP